MWFRQLTFYRLSDGPLPSSEQLAAALEGKPFQHCSGLDWFTEGWVAPARHLEALTFSVRDCQMIALLREEKVLPAAVIRDILDEKIAHLEARDGRKVGRKEKLALKEQITDDLLPRAFVRTQRITAYLDKSRRWLMINTGTASKAENLISKFREVLSFSAMLPRTCIAPHTAMTDWLIAAEAPNGFEFHTDCELKDSSEQGAVIRCSRMDLTADEVRQHMTSGKQVTQLGLIWRERISFVLTSSLQLKRIQFLDMLQDEASQASDDTASLFEATFILMSQELSQLVDELTEALGGLEKIDKLKRQLF